MLERIYPMLAWDSWVYMGCTAVPCKAGQAMQENNVDFSSWNMNHGLNITDGAIFFLDPTKAFKPKGGAASASGTMLRSTVVQGGLGKRDDNAVRLIHCFVCWRGFEIWDPGITLPCLNLQCYTSEQHGVSSCSTIEL